MSVVIRGNGKEKGYLVQGIIVGIVIRQGKAKKKKVNTPWNKIQQVQSEKEKRLERY
jgi:hypothetical protein